MRAIILLLALAGLFAAPGRAAAGSGPDGRAGLRARVVAEARKLVGIREHGRNRGPEVDALIKEAGGQPGQAWCSWTVVVIMRRAGIPVPRFGKALAWFDAAHVVWRNGAAVLGRALPQPGDLLSFSWGSHVETQVGPWGTGPSVRAVGGNTGGGGALKREGEGVYENWRLKRMIPAVANVVDNPKY
ncbi:hypothetical protein JAO73_10455 [Hymenobacter sp. BT523]|uniref:CHAP domain-containing protein n=1 Tax=Hymenobacter sp. BT523 TaxID=2795725 RepID=UPI0018EBDA5E|nr:CHAP domain-containing protein [Hymenobacter sp. BT523]MBJ6109436.1 hypothetical protein [Hymenobacter sp. BT523]